MEKIKEIFNYLYVEKTTHTRMEVLLPHILILYILIKIS